VIATLIWVIRWTAHFIEAGVGNMLRSKTEVGSYHKAEGIQFSKSGSKEGELTHF